MCVEGGVKRMERIDVGHRKAGSNVLSKKVHEHIEVIIRL